MNKMRWISLAAVAAVAGCSSAVTQTQHAAAHHQWDTARAAVLYSLATEQYQNGTFDKCQESLDQALRLSPDDANILLLASKVSIEQGKMEPALALAERARTVDPKSAEADYLCGVIWQRWANPRRAYDAYVAASGKNAGEMSYVLAQAEMLVALGRPADALSYLKTKEPAFDHSGVLRDEVGQLLVQQKRYPAAVAELRLAAQLTTDDPTVHEHLGFALLIDGDYAAAADTFDRLVKSGGGAKRADLWGALGQCQRQMGKTRECRQSFERASEFDGDSVGYVLEIGRACVELGDLPRADLTARRAIAVSPESSAARCLLGYVRLKEGKLTDALIAFEAAADLDPCDTVSRCMSGYVLKKLDRPDDSRRALAAALKLRPGDELANALMAGVDRHD